MINQNKDHIIIKDGYVYRPRGIWTNNVHKLLHYLHASYFSVVPWPIGFDDKFREIVTYISGNTGEFPSNVNLISDNALISAAELLRKFHDVSAEFLRTQNIDHNQWQFKAKAPMEVICHGDFAPYNVIYESQEIVGIIDFDCAHPGPLAWDVAYALYRWAPLTNLTNKDGFGNLEEQLIRAKLFLDSYEFALPDRIGLVELIIERLKTLVKFMITKAKVGDQIQQQNIKNNHHLGYLADIDYIKANKQIIEQSLYY